MDAHSVHRNVVATWGYDIKVFVDADVYILFISVFQENV